MSLALLIMVRILSGQAVKTLSEASSAGSRRHAELTSIVNGFSGVLQSDGYQAYGAHARVHPEVS